MGVAVWPMIELEADDALASAARIAAADERVEKVCIWTPDKDLAQCVAATASCRWTAAGKKIRDAAGVREKFGVEPALIPDYLALVGDAADGYPGIAGIGAVGAARLLNRHGAIETFPPTVLGERARARAAVQGPRDAADRRGAVSTTWTSCAGAGRPTNSRAWAERMDAPRLLERCLEVKESCRAPREA